MTQPTSQRSNSSKLKIVLLAPVLGLLILEVGFRIRVHQRNRRTLAEALEVPAIQEENSRTRFIDIIQPHINDNIIYELRPDLNTTFKGQALHTNSHGLRSPERAHQAEDGELTIVGIGASMMFGHGLSDEELYAPILEQALNQKYPHSKWRFINTAVPSHNVVMKVETLIDKGLAFKPDLVLLNIAGNNLDLPEYVRKHEDPLAGDRSFLLDFFSDWSGRKRIHEERMAEMAWVDRKKIEWNPLIKTDPEKIPEEYQDLLGWKPFRAALDKLEELGREHDFEVVIFAFIEHDLVPGMLEEGRQRGFHVSSLMPDLEAYFEEKTGSGFTVEKYKASELVVSGQNLHPSRIQHRMAMQRLLADLESTGVVDRLLEREGGE